MSYKQKTAYLGIPVVGFDDHIEPETELRKYQIIENMLIAGTQGVKCCVFDDGDYRIERQADGQYEVTLSATGGSPSASGMVGGAYFFTTDQLKWSDLKAGEMHYLSLTGSYKTFANPSRVRTVSSIPLRSTGTGTRCTMRPAASPLPGGHPERSTSLRS